MTGPIINSSSSSSGSSVNAQEPFPIHKLPVDIHSYICQYLDPKSIQNLTCATKTLKHVTLWSVNQSKPAEVKKFIEALISKLNIDKHPQQIEKLQEIRASIQGDLSLRGFQGVTTVADSLKDEELPLDEIELVGDTSKDEELDPVDEELAPINEPLDKYDLPLSELKNRILMLKDQIIDVLITSDQPTLDHLRQIPLPIFCEHIFKITDCFHNQNQDAASNCRTLTLLGEYKKAMKLAHTIPDKLKKSTALKEIVDTLIEIGDPAIAGALPEQKGNIDKAIEVAHTIPGIMQKEFAFWRITDTLIIGMRNTNKAFEVAHSISNPTLQSLVIRNIEETCKTQRIRDQEAARVAQASSGPSLSHE